MTSSDERDTRQLPGSPRSPRRTVKEGPLFAEDQTVAGRYRIVRLIASGGMGEVYEAFDLHLRENVALKTLRSESVEDDAAIERSKREIQLARRVTHPNVCRVF